MLKKYAIIVAGGSGSRMKSVIAKQFLPLHGKPILAHTVEKFLKIPNNEVIAVLPEKDMLFWDEIIIGNPLLSEALKKGNLRTVKGGSTRYQSVTNGLQEIKGEDGIVAIHDGVRPIISLELIMQSYEEAEANGSAVLGVALKDSAREVDAHGNNKAIDRSKIRLIQTPQTFKLNTIKEAYAKGEEDFFTDDASVYEFAGHEVNLITGDYKNIKITTPEDLSLAENWI